MQKSSWTKGARSLSLIHILYLFSIRVSRFPSAIFAAVASISPMGRTMLRMKNMPVHTLNSTTAVTSARLKADVYKRQLNERAAGLRLVGGKLGQRRVNGIPVNALLRQPAPDLPWRDVYKRQASVSRFFWNGCWRRLLRPENFCLLPAGVGLRRFSTFFVEASSVYFSSVSYTHLEVYKRQDIFLRPG